MTRKRTPVAEIGAEDYRIVKHTHDVKRAAALMRAKLYEESGCPGTTLDWCPMSKVCLHKHRPGRAAKVWIRIVPTLPGSYAESEGWAFSYMECRGGRGAFPAVLFR